jgi:hypothetical protein
MSPLLPSSLPPFLPSTEFTPSLWYAQIDVTVVDASGSLDGVNVLDGAIDDNVVGGLSYSLSSSTTQTIAAAGGLGDFNLVLQSVLEANSFCSFPGLGARPDCALLATAASVFAGCNSRCSDCVDSTYSGCLLCVAGFALFSSTPTSCLSTYLGG